MPTDFRKFWQFPAKPGELDKDGTAGTPPQEDHAQITHQNSALEEGGRLVYPEYDPWPDSVFSAVPEVGQGYEQIADSMADKVRRDQAYGRVYLPPPAWNTFRIVSNSPAAATGQNGWLVKESTCILHSIVPSQAGTNWVVSIFDGQGVSVPDFRYLTAMGLVPLVLDYKLMNGLWITAAGTAGELVIAYL
jgi:hypothetical protein